MSQYQYSSSVFIGETTRGIAMPVFWDTHTSIVNNRPPGCLITGAPGSGKTFLALTITTISAILGKTTIVLDPKGDFLSLINLKKDIGEENLKIWNLAKGESGMLDPFFMTDDDSEKLTLVIEVIDLFVGGLTPDQETALGPIIKDVIQSKNPSLQVVIDELRGSQNDVARHLGTQLDLLKSMKFANLCFAPGANRKRKSISIDKGVTIITLMGLELPNPGEESLTRQNKLASGIMFLLTDFIRRIMMNDNSQNPKTLVIDEAHAILSSQAGARTIRSVALLGRSKYLALVLITQNNSHLKNLDIENTISTRFAFRSDRREAEEIVAAMELPHREGFEDIIINLGNGECLMKDFLNRYSTVQISNWNSEWNEAFKTNPLDRLKKQKEKMKKQQVSK